MRVQLIGYYGWGNFGDDLFRELCLANAERMWPGDEVRALEGPRANYGTGPGTSLNRAFTAIRGAMWADTFAYCGGSVFSTHSGVSRLRGRLQSVRRFEALGVSVGPFDSDESQNAVANFLAGFERIVVRDSESRDRLRGNCVLGGDLAALSSRFDDTAAASRTGPVLRFDAGDYLLVCPSRAAGGDADGVAASVHTALATIPQRQGAMTPPIVVLSLNAHPDPDRGDGRLVTDVAAELGRLGHLVEAQHYAEIGIDGVIAIIGDAAAVWTQRLHGAVAAYLAGTPFAIVDHHEKCGAFARDIGLDRRLLVTDFALLGEGARLSLSGWRPTPGDEPGQPGVFCSMSSGAYRARAREAYFHD